MPGDPLSGRKVGETLDREIGKPGAHGLDGPVIHETIYPVAFLRGDRAEMERQLERGQPITETRPFSRNTRTPKPITCDCARHGNCPDARRNP
jgi:hypothetical protein